VELELERDPRAHKNVRCLHFFFVFLFVLFEEGLRSLLLPLSLLHYSSATAQQRRRPSSSALQKKEEEGLFLLIFCSKRRRPSSFLQQKKNAFFFFLFLCYTAVQFQRSKNEGLLLHSLSLLHCKINY